MRTDSVLYTLETSRDQFAMQAGSGFIYRLRGDEDRAQFESDWLRRSEVDDASVLAITGEDEHSFTFVLSKVDIADEMSVDVFEPDEVEAFISLLPSRVYMDVTGLAHRTWAPLLKALVAKGKVPLLLYVEPMRYSATEAPEKGRIFSLSESVGAISPIPGFARLPDDTSAETILIPLLGFEGPRFGRLLDQSVPSLYDTYPVIGMPGYRPEYVLYAYQGNRDYLDEAYLHSRVQYAKANCPFEAFRTIYDIDSWSGHAKRLRLAPIGTKPHGIGAVLYAMAAGERVELIYDHPVKLRARSEGASRLCVFDVGAFVVSPLYRLVSNGG